MGAVEIMEKIRAMENNEIRLQDLVVNMPGHVYCPKCMTDGLDSEKKMCDLCHGVGQLHIQDVPEHIRAQVAQSVMKSLEGPCNCPNCKGKRKHGEGVIQATEEGESPESDEEGEEGGNIVWLRR